MENSINHFFSYEDSEEARTIHTKNDKIETIIENQTDEIIEELINCLLQRSKLIRRKTEKR